MGRDNQYAALLQRLFAQPTARTLTPGEVPVSCETCGGSRLVPVAKRGFDYDFANCPDCTAMPDIEMHWCKIIAGPNAGRRKQVTAPPGLWPSPKAQNDQSDCWPRTHDWGRA